jgi:hypothetical protein
MAAGCLFRCCITLRAKRSHARQGREKARRRRDCGRCRGRCPVGYCHGGPRLAECGRRRRERIQAIAVVRKKLNPAQAPCLGNIRDEVRREQRFSFLNGVISGNEMPAAVLRQKQMKLRGNGGTKAHVWSTLICSAMTDILRDKACRQPGFGLFRTRMVYESDGRRCPAGHEPRPS